MRRLGLAKRLAPFVVTLGAIAYLVGTVDLRGALSQVDSHAALVLIPALLVYGALSLLIEAMTLIRLVPDRKNSFGLWTASRVKAASYLTALIHYALGAGTLALLLRKRAGIDLIEAAGVVSLIVMFDLGVLLAMVALGIGLISTVTPTVQVGLILSIFGLISVGFALLRTPFSLGPLERLQNHRLFRAARTTSPERLVEVGLLRLSFVLCFLALGWTAFGAFGLTVPLGDFLVNFAAVILMAFLPSVASIGPSQVGMVEFFAPFADRETLLACTVALSAGLILLRAGIGILFARELTREVYAAAREPKIET